MPESDALPAVPLPRQWTTFVRAAVLHSISLAFTALTGARAKACTSRSRQTRLLANLDQARTEVALLKEELSIKDARWSRIAPRRRPYYRPVQRMRILELKAARGWSAAQAARVFLVTEETIASWLIRVDEEGEQALVRTPQPVNRFPDFVGHLVRWLKSMCPTLGKKRIAQVLARAGLHLGVTTVRRMLSKDSWQGDVIEAALSTEEGEASPISTRVVTAKYPNHVFHVDLTVVPTAAGFWVPWLPFAKPQGWPFGWWVAGLLDHFSRYLIGFAVFRQRPTSADVCSFLDRAIRKAGTKPRHIISDKGKQFWCETYKAWCHRKRINPRFGAVGKKGSIAVIERFVRSLKSECTRQVLVSLNLEALRHELAYYAVWYNEHRPSQALAGRTPKEVYKDLPPKNEEPRFEPRRKWPVSSPCAAPLTSIDGKRGSRLTLVLKFMEGRKHLPIVELQRAA